jgi:predicted component of type VI protein secretion system
MNRWKAGGVAALMVLALAIAGCDQQETDTQTSPSIDITVPGTTSPGMTDDAGTDVSPSPTGS